MPRAAKLAGLDGGLEAWSRAKGEGIRGGKLGKGPAATVRAFARGTHGVATTAANDERHTGFMCAACAQFRGSVLG